MAKTKIRTKTPNPKPPDKGTPIAQGKEKVVAKGAAEPAAPAKSRVNPFRFLQQVRQETAKVTWPTRRETMTTTVMVFVMVLLCALFFFLVDQLLGTAVRYALHLAG
jgi:preprotein translocase subunit SecE